MGFEAGIVEVGSFACVLAVGCVEGIGVGAFDGEIGPPQTSLRVANRRAGGIVRRVIGGLRYEPWEIPPACLRDVWMMVTIMPRYVRASMSCSAGW